MAHYAVTIVPDAHKNALNVAFALWQSEDASQSENVSIALNATGSPEDPVTHWIGGQFYDTERLAVLQDLANSVPAASWPVTGVSGSVTEQQAVDAAAACTVVAGTADSYPALLAQQTLASALGALGLQRVNYEE